MLNYIGITIILLLLLLEGYFYLYKSKDNFTNIKKEKETNETKLTGLTKTEGSPIVDDNVLDVIEFEEQNPWYKAIIGKNDYTKYFIKIKNFDNEKFIEWKALVKNLDYDVDSKSLIITTDTEGEALAVINLIISNMNRDITLSEIIEKDLIKISIKKAKSHKLVCNKLIELIKNNNKEMSNNTQIDYIMDTANMPKIMHIQNNENQLLNNVNKNIFGDEPIEKYDSYIQPYGGSEFSLI